MGLEFADRLNLLFRAFLKPPGDTGHRTEWSNGEVARVAEQLADGLGLTRQYLRMLRTGERGKPSLETAYAIARAFEHLSRTSPSPGHASAVVAYLATDPTHASAAEIARVEDIHQRLTTAIGRRDHPDDPDHLDDVRRHLSQHVGVGDNQLLGLVARLGRLQDPESLRSVRALVDQLAEQEELALPPLRRGSRRRRGSELR